MLLNNAYPTGLRAAVFSRLLASNVNGMFAHHTRVSLLERSQASISSIISLFIHCYILSVSFCGQCFKTSHVLFCTFKCLFLWLWVIFWAVDDISFKLLVCVCDLWPKCLPHNCFNCTIFSLRHGLADYAMLTHTCGPGFKGRARLFPL